MSQIPRVYAEQTLAVGDITPLPSKVAHHVTRVLRLGVDAPVTVFNGDGYDYHGRLSLVHRDTASVQVLEQVAVHNESPLQITLVQGVSKGDRMDYAIQKAVELGVHTIQPVLTKRNAVKLDKTRLGKKTAHWQQVVVSACEQSGRAVVPVVQQAISLTQWLTLVTDRAEANGATIRLILDPYAAESHVTPSGAEQVEMLIGPEGGFTDEEVAYAINQGYTGLKLGPRILRTETAAAAAMAVLQARWGDI